LFGIVLFFTQKQFYLLKSAPYSEFVTYMYNLF